MSILQISAPKSGSYWLHTILTEILERKDIPIKSFIQEQPIYHQLKDRELSFRGQARVDMLDIEEDGCYYRISSLYREPIPDVRDYVQTTTLAWTHSTFCDRSPDVLTLFDKKICIIRDPRDRALSSAKFAFTPYMQQHYPSSYSSPEEYLQEEYGRLLEQWMWFTGNYLLQKEKLNIHFVFYERLLNNFLPELQNLLGYLGIPLSAHQQQEIANAVSFSSMKTKSPEHLHKGTYGKWVAQLTDTQIQAASEKTGKLMRLLNYPLSPEEKHQLPYMPGQIPTGKLQNLMKEIHWQDLYT